jgi:hypothetical protein
MNCSVSGSTEKDVMAIFVVYVRRDQTWSEIARFEANGTRDALIKSEHVIPTSYGSGPVRLIEHVHR